MADSDGYPIPIDPNVGMTQAQARRVVCDSGCGYERDATGEEIAGGRFQDVGPACPRCKSVPLVFKYEHGLLCPGCGRLGWWQSGYDDNACSRACHLQAEYAAELARSRG